MNVYEDMQQILKDRGRCTTTMTKHDGSTCLVGASYLATGEDFNFMFYNETKYYEDTPQTDKLAKIIREQFPDSPFLNPFDTKSHVICYTFNDGHSDEDVMLILQKAAADELS